MTCFTPLAIHVPLEANKEIKTPQAFTGTHCWLEEMRSFVVTDLLFASEHFTSRVNSTAQSGQKSVQTQSFEVVRCDVWAYVGVYMWVYV